MQQLLDEGAFSKFRGIPLGRLADRPHHAGPAVEAGAVDEVSFKIVACHPRASLMATSFPAAETITDDSSV